MGDETTEQLKYLHHALGLLIEQRAAAVEQVDAKIKDTGSQIIAALHGGKDTNRETHASEGGAATAGSSNGKGKETKKDQVVRLLMENPGVHSMDLLPMMGFPNDAQHKNTLRSIISALGKEGRIEKYGEAGHWRVTQHGRTGKKGRTRGTKTEAASKPKSAESTASSNAASAAEHATETSH